MTIGVAAVTLLLGACSDEPAGQVAVPGAPAGGDTRPAVSTVAPDVTNSTTPSSTATSPPAAATSTTVAVSTTIPATTVPGTTIAPTTTALVYTPEAADGALRTGSEGPRSLKLQQDLILLEYLPASAADGKFGPGTAGGIRRFQQAEDLVVDGVAGPNTLQALDVAVTEANAGTPDVD